MKKHLTCLYAALGGISLLAALAMATGWMKTRPDFCVSCHLPNGERLHAEKNKAFKADVAANLAAAHGKKSAEPFECITCHRGSTASERLKVQAEELKNTAAYFLFKFEEPKKMDASLMPDENCSACHRAYKGGPTSFHGMKAHNPTLIVPCIACHKAHPDGDAANFFIVENEVLTVCKKCHPHLPPSFRLGGRTPS